MFESIDRYNPIEKIKELTKKKLPYDYEDFSDTEIKDEEGNLRTYYYGTNTKKESNNFRTDEHGVVFLTPSFEFAKRFVKNTHGHSDYDRGRIISVNINAKKVFDYEKPEHMDDVLPLVEEKIAKEKMSELSKEVLLSSFKLGSYSGYRNKKVIEALKEKGYDGYYELEDFEGKTKSLGIFNKEQIKELTTKKIPRSEIESEIGHKMD